MTYKIVIFIATSIIKHAIIRLCLIWSWQFPHFNLLPFLYILPQYFQTGIKTLYWLSESTPISSSDRRYVPGQCLSWNIPSVLGHMPPIYKRLWCQDVSAHFHFGPFPFRPTFQDVSAQVVSAQDISAQDVSAHIYSLLFVNILCLF